MLLTRSAWSANPRLPTAIATSIERDIFIRNRAHTRSRFGDGQAYQSSASSARGRGRKSGFVLVRANAQPGLLRRVGEGQNAFLRRNAEVGVVFDQHVAVD